MGVGGRKKAVWCGVWAQELSAGTAVSTLAGPGLGRGILSGEREGNEPSLGGNEPPLMWSSILTTQKRHTENNVEL